MYILTHKEYISVIKYEGTMVQAFDFQILAISGKRRANVSHRRDGLHGLASGNGRPPETSKITVQGSMQATLNIGVADVAVLKLS